ncbi:hypothetical protein [Arthrobacter sp. MA-N2]|uniref:hypothetical protein n=1 Tax=Arthrobacter sp. MA-N2 TaxID=1101188 RepID=UPI00055325F5|nr:hypothetical protein [Arthrobacter sp. MA-N2]
MDENRDEKFPSPAVDRDPLRDRGSFVEEYEHPTTHQMRIVGQRRTDAEAKLERQQREAREKLPE